MGSELPKWKASTCSPLRLSPWGVGRGELLSRKLMWSQTTWHWTLCTLGPVASPPGLSGTTEETQTLVKK